MEVYQSKMKMYAIEAREDIPLCQEDEVWDGEMDTGVDRSVGTHEEEDKLVVSDEEGGEDGSLF
jgi:hypothetical protein